MGQVLQFALKPKAVQEPVAATAPIKLNITETECRHLDAVIDRAINVLDVVRSGPEIICDFLKGDLTLATTVKFQGVDYELRLDLQPKVIPPKFA
jgi:hypothetical protein